MKIMIYLSLYRGTIYYLEGHNKKRSINKDYKEIAVTGYVKHGYQNLNTSSILLKEGPGSYMCLFQRLVSFVWSVKKYFLPII